MQRTNLTLQAGESKPPLPRHYVSTRPPTVSLESFTTLANVGEQGPRKYSQYMPGRRMSENSGTARRPWRISFHDKRLSRRHYLPPQLSRAVSSKIKKKVTQICFMHELLVFLYAALQQSNPHGRLIRLSHGHATQPLELYN